MWRLRHKCRATWITGTRADPRGRLPAQQEDYADDFGELLCGSASGFVRQVAAKCFAAAVELHPATAAATLAALVGLYNAHPDAAAGFANGKPPPPVPAAVELTNEAGELFAADCRQAVGQAFKALSPLLPPAGVPGLIKFLVSRPLGDLNDAVKDTMVQAALQLVDDHGEQQADAMFPVLEGYLALPDFSEAEAVAVQDRVRESVVICLGGLAKHLPADGGKPQEIMDRLLVRRGARLAAFCSNLPPATFRAWQLSSATV